MPDSDTDNGSSGSESGAEEEAPLEFEHKKHVGFWLRHIRLLPTHYQGAEVQRMSLAYFCLLALDLLGVLDDEKIMPAEEKRGYADWVYAQQLSRREGGGFAGGPALPEAKDDGKPSTTAVSCEGQLSVPPQRSRTAHLVMSLFAIMSLAMLRDDFCRLDKKGLLSYVARCQRKDGSFQPDLTQVLPESDNRHVFTALAICSLLNGFTAVDLDSALRFVRGTQTYEGAFGQEASQEAHGGSTMCAVGSLAFSNSLDSIETDPLVAWLAARQQGRKGGSNGRTDKLPDTCYSLWIGASLAMLGKHHLIDGAADVRWLLRNQTPIGGIRKSAEHGPDAMHASLALAALSLHVYPWSAGEQGDLERGEETIMPDSLRAGIKKAIDPRYILTTDAVEWCHKHLH